MREDLVRLVYVSRSEMTGDEAARAAEMERLLRGARARNRAAGVTGALVVGEGCFVQVLEGGAEALEPIFESIQRDPRHGAVTVLEAGPVPARAFGDWDMAYAPRPVPGLRHAALAVPDAGASAESLLDLLRAVALAEQRSVAA